MWLESIAMALRSVRTNKTRSFLTMLGIIIGVASLMAMLGIGAGAQAQILEQIRSLGSNVLMIQPGAVQDGALSKQLGTAHTLTVDDAAAIGMELQSVAASAPSLRGTAQIVNGSRNWSTTVNGATASYFFIRSWRLASGRSFAFDEEKSAGKVAVLGATVAKQLFSGSSAVGRRIRIASVPFEVIGVLDKKGPSGSGQDQDDVVFVPVSTARLRLFGGASQINRQSISYILVKARSGALMQTAESEIKALLRQRHGLHGSSADDFVIENPAAAMAAQHASTATIAWLLAALASVSLVVGGISIMNIMLVSVTERTREIGLRLAVGARRRDIRNQFLTEAVILCGVGGSLGLALGAAASAMVARLAGWAVFLSPGAALFALGFAASVGVFFGYYPARRAARLNPVEALRTE